MKTNKRKTILIILMMLIVSIASFMFVLPEEKKVSEAVISGVSGSVIVLTGQQGTQPSSYFVDSNGGSTLSKAKTTTGSYVNENGDSTSEFYIITGDTDNFINDFTSSESYGYAEFTLTSEMQKFADLGFLYVQASAGIVSLDTDKNDRVKISLLDSEYSELSAVESREVNKDQISNTEWLKTDFVKVTTGSVIFRFKALAKGSVWNKCEYKIYEPKLTFKLILNSDSGDIITFPQESNNAYPGEILDLKAENEATKGVTNQSTEFAKYFASIHRISYEITQGSEHANIIDGSLYLEDDLQEGDKIGLRAKCLKDSLGTEYIYSNEVVFTVSTQKYEINITSDFSTPGTFLPKGSYYAGEKIVIQAKLNPGYKFNQSKKWEINGKVVNTDKVVYTVKEENNIICNLVKEVSVSQIIIQEKTYDGNINATPNISLVGVEAGHDVSLSGLSFMFSSANAGTNIQVITSGLPKLEGTNKGLYELKNETVEPLTKNLKGNITQRAITVTAKSKQKTYGNEDPIFDWKTSGDLVQGDQIQGGLSRILGEDVGTYQINKGDLDSKNPNYNITFIPTIFTINKRETSLSFDIKDKVYDGNTDVNFTYSLSNIIDSDQYKVNAEVKLSYSSVNAGYGIAVNCLDCKLLGDKANNYALVNPSQELEGNILRRDIHIAAKDAQKIYGEQDPELVYEINEGLIGDDTLTGALSRDEGENVGEYIISEGTLKNSNYKISFTSGNFTIAKRKLTLTANKKQKTYGEQDPVLDWNITDGELVNGDRLQGTLVRDQGESIGEYKIDKYDLDNSNPNYNINFVTSILTIVKRDITISVKDIEKEYDGTTSVNSYKTQIINWLSSDDLSFSAQLVYKSSEAGNAVEVKMTNPDIRGENLDCYNITVITDGLTGKIKKKNCTVTLANLSKVYGEEDPELTYTADGLVAGQTLTGDLTRDPGENVGRYEITAQELTNRNNNYNISINYAYLTITKRDLVVKANNASKVFGDDDPNFELEILSGLKEGETKDEAIVGKMEVNNALNPGQYSITMGTVSATQNYAIKEFIEGCYTITKRSVTVVVNELEKTYGEQDPEFSFRVENAVEGYGVGLNLKRVSGENVGLYKITYSTLNNPRYEITFVDGYLKINPSEIKLMAEDKKKTYGAVDPKFSAKVVEGSLKNNDSISSIQQGAMERSSGESVGKYSITQGSYNLGENYIVVFEAGEFEIIKEDIVIKADVVQKRYREIDPKLTFKVLQGNLSFGDSFSGELSREDGENVGEYKILIGDLRLNDNYNLEFIDSLFTINKRPVTISAKSATKVYGEEDPEFEYEVDDAFCKDDVLDGSLYRDIDNQDQKAFEMAGKYIIRSSLNNPNYEIIYNANYLTIKQREIYIKADSYSKVYGEEDPVLTYQITSGEIFNGDQIEGEIYRNQGESAGSYDIRSNLVLGRNYKIVFTKGVFKILPIKLQIKTFDYEKIYGEIDPEFEYEIVSGSLLGEDVLLGGVSREKGEDVGVYKLVNSFNNTNYDIELTENYLTINPKEIYLKSKICDKVYNGDGVAYLKNPSVTGLIDEGVLLSYDKNNCARFETYEPGNDIKVFVFDIALSGEKSGNYTLVLPEFLYGNITYNEVFDKDKDVSIFTQTNTDIKAGSVLVANKEDENLIPEVVSFGKTFVTGYNIELLKDGNAVDIKDSISLKIEIPDEYKSMENFYVYGYNKNQELKLLSCEKIDGELVISTDSLGKIVILTENEHWINCMFYIMISALGAFVIGVGIYFVIKRIRKKKATA